MSAANSDVHWMLITSERVYKTLIINEMGQNNSITASSQWDNNVLSCVSSFDAVMIMLLLYVIVLMFVRSATEWLLADVCKESFIQSICIWTLCRPVQFSPLSGLTEFGWRVVYNYCMFIPPPPLRPPPLPRIWKNKMQFKKGETKQSAK